MIDSSGSIFTHKDAIIAAAKAIVNRLPDGSVTQDFPGHQSDFHHSQPVYEELEGWGVDISGVRSFDQLPAAARTYLRRVEELVAVPVAIVGVGQRRDQIVMLREYPVAA